jgi:hypothetical protein
MQFEHKKDKKEKKEDAVIKTKLSVLVFLERWIRTRDFDFDERLALKVLFPNLVLIYI